MWFFKNWNCSFTYTPHLLYIVDANLRYSTFFLGQKALGISWNAVSLIKIAKRISNIIYIGHAPGQFFLWYYNYVVQEFNSTASDIAYKKVCLYFEIKNCHFQKSTGWSCEEPIECKITKSFIWDQSQL